MGTVAIRQGHGFRITVGRAVDEAAWTRAAEDRFRSMVDTHFDFIWRTLRGHGVPVANADDAAQHVFLIAAQKLDLIEIGSERSFLFSTARGIAANVRRAQLRNREVLDDELGWNAADVSPNPEQHFANGEAREVLSQILDGLADELRAVFVLFELEGMTTAQVAELLGVPSGTVASRLRRAREEFHAATKRFQARQKGGT